MQESPTPLKAVDVHILLVLAAHEMHGYGMVQEIEALSGGGLRLEPGNLYRYLKRLESAGLVQALGRREVPDDPSARRRYYGITARGREVLATEGARMRAFASAVERRLAEGGSG